MRRTDGDEVHNQHHSNSSGCEFTAEARAIGFAQIRGISVPHFWTRLACLRTDKSRNSRRNPKLPSFGFAPDSRNSRRKGPGLSRCILTRHR